MKFRTLHEEYDTERVRVETNTEKAYRMLCDNIKEPIINSAINYKAYNYVARFTNSVLVDVFGNGVAADGCMIFKSDDMIERKTNHTGFTHCGYEFECDGTTALKVINEIFSHEITTEYANNIGKIFCGMLKEE